MRVVVEPKGLQDGADFYRKLSKGVKKRVDGALKAFGDVCAEKLKTEAYAGAYGPPKRRGSGPPLIDSGKYINSIKATVKGGLLTIRPEGMNDNMSNEALGELLEYGNGAGIPARPHMRPLSLYIERVAASFLGARIVGL